MIAPTMTIDRGD